MLHCNVFHARSPLFCSVKHGHPILKTVCITFGIFCDTFVQLSPLLLLSVNALIFLAPISAFDQVLAEVQISSVLRSRLSSIPTARPY